MLLTVSDVLIAAAAECSAAGRLPPNAFARGFVVREHTHPSVRRAFSHFSPTCITEAHEHLKRSPPSPAHSESQCGHSFNSDVPPSSPSPTPAQSLALHWSKIVASAAQSAFADGQWPALAGWSVRFHAASTDVARVGYVDIAIAPSSASSLSSAHSPPATVACLPLTFTFTPIGRLCSCFKQKFATPRQGALSPSSRATLTLSSHIHPSSLSGLSSFSHVWLLFVFHHNSNASAPALIHPPRLHGGSIGVFASRSPHRPNPLGLSLVRLAAVDQPRRTLTFTGVDIIDGTPILDIKPYHPSDAPPADGLVMPAWVAAGDAALTVNVAPVVMEELEVSVERMRGWESAEEVVRLIVEMVSGDPRPVYLRGKAEGREAVYGMRLDALNVLYWVDDVAQHATVCGVEWVGYAEADGEDEDARTKRWLAERGRSDRRSRRAPMHNAPPLHS